MKKIILLLALLALLAGCQKIDNNNTETTAKSEETENLIEETTVTGILLERFMENDTKFIEISVDGKTLKLDASNYEDFEELEAGYELKITYKDNKLLSVDNIKINDLVSEEEINHAQPLEKEIYLTKNINLNSLNKYSSLEIGNFYDPNIKSIKIYTDAETDDKGNFLFDDGNRFLVVAHEENGGYVLLDERLQFSSIKINAFMENDKFMISMLQSSSANIVFKTFEKSTNSFIEKTHYQGQGNINMIGNI